jgi:hypothetical protein
VGSIRKMKRQTHSTPWALQSSLSLVTLYYSDVTCRIMSENVLKIQLFVRTPVRAEVANQEILICDLWVINSVSSCDPFHILELQNCRC